MEGQAVPGEASMQWEKGVSWQHRGVVLLRRVSEEGTLSRCPILKRMRSLFLLQPGAGVTLRFLPQGLLSLCHHSHQIKGRDLGLSGQDLKPTFSCSFSFYFGSTGD